jgi:hypothetical protein
VGSYQPYGECIARQICEFEPRCLEVVCASAWGVLVFAIIEHLRPSSLHFNPTAQRTYRVCGWELTGASKDPYPGQVDAKLHDRLCAHAMGTWAVVNLARGWRQACFLLQQACWSFT